MNEIGSRFRVVATICYVALFLFFVVKIDNETTEIVEKFLGLKITNETWYAPLAPRDPRTCLDVGHPDEYYYERYLIAHQEFAYYRVYGQFALVRAVWKRFYGMFSAPQNVTYYEKSEWGLECWLCLSRYYQSYSVYAWNSKEHFNAENIEEALWFMEDHSYDRKWTQEFAGEYPEHGKRLLDALLMWYPYVKLCDEHLKMIHKACYEGEKDYVFQHHLGNRIKLWQDQLGATGMWGEPDKALDSSKNARLFQESLQQEFDQRVCALGSWWYLWHRSSWEFYREQVLEETKGISRFVRDYKEFEEPWNNVKAKLSF